MQCPYVLVIEDETAIRETLKLTLELNGHSVRTASNGQEGLNALADPEKPALVLLDLMMPVMDGWQFLKAVENSSDMALRQIPVVVITALGDRARTVREHGSVRDMIKKPLNIDTLLKVVGEYCH